MSGIWEKLTWPWPFSKEDEKCIYLFDCKIEWNKLCLNELQDWMKEIIFEWIVRLDERNYV